MAAYSLGGFLGSWGELGGEAGESGESDGFPDNMCFYILFMGRLALYDWCDRVVLSPPALFSYPLSPLALEYYTQTLILVN